MNQELNNSNETERIRKEYARRSKEIPEDYYSLKHPWNQVMRESRQRAASETLQKFFKSDFKDLKVFEVGCGRGEWFSDFSQWGFLEVNIHGIDLDENRIAIAKETYPQSQISVGDASRLDYPDASFDLVLQSTVFSSVLDAEMKKAIAREMLRVLKPSGVILWYDFFYDNPWNLNVKGVTAREIKSLFPNYRIQLKRITLAPPITRFLAPISTRFCGFLESLKVLNTHYLGVISCR